MDNYNLKINLLKLTKAGVINVNGHECVVIPIAENWLYKGQSSVYLDLAMWTRREQGRFGDTHYIKQSMPKQWRSANPNGQAPIIGDAKPIELTQQQPQAQPVPQMTAPAEPQIGETSDLPF